METLNHIFGADTSILWMRSVEMFKAFPLGYMVALFAWPLIFPPFFTPGTLFFYDDVASETAPLAVRYLPIANTTLAHNITYSPDYLGDRPEFRNNATKVINGPRTQVTLLTTATSAGRMLAIQPPSSISSYITNFYGPAVRCFPADRRHSPPFSSYLKKIKRIG
ncbi:hypothetical protein B0H63DRAFT_139480 [Podospora didyma]|uniref:Uncharacterized protein n=1 Tax=Podospora didyma TaxID=330526 RepID=A0AAE0U127_9PEZI|nr:hypothetical protein B0H63DRAFT_139480 [Podospora didyma]